MLKHILANYDKGHWWIPTAHCRTTGKKFDRNLFKEAVKLLTPHQDHPAVKVALNHFNHYLTNYEQL